ncbi:MAG: hypothetical protein V7752_12100 [Halopseudomonas sp.]
MSQKPNSDPIAICEDILNSEKSYNIEHSILQSENRIIDRFLSRRVELTEAYAELVVKLHGRPQALKVMLGVLLSASAFWNPEKNRAARQARAELFEINREVAERAGELAVLLERRSELHNTSGFSSDTHNDICRVIDAAAAEQHLFKWHVQESLARLRGQYDRKYCPSLAACIGELAIDAREASIGATDQITDAATSSRKPSLTDFFKAWFASIEENSAQSSGFLPTDLRLSDNTMASLANCALDLGPDELIDGAYVKRLRQRLREQS